MKKRCSSTYRPNGTTLRCELPRGHECAHTSDRYWWHDLNEKPQPSIHWSFGCVFVIILILALVEIFRSLL